MEWQNQNIPPDENVQIIGRYKQLPFEEKYNYFILKYIDGLWYVNEIPLRAVCAPNEWKYP